MDYLEFVWIFASNYTDGGMTQTDFPIPSPTGQFTVAQPYTRRSVGLMISQQCHHGKMVLQDSDDVNVLSKYSHYDSAIEVLTLRCP